MAPSASELPRSSGQAGWRRIYFNAKGKAKLELGLAKGRKKEDKRAAIKERDGKREAARAMKNKGRE